MDKPLNNFISYKYMGSLNDKLKKFMNVKFLYCFKITVQKNL